MFRPIVVKTRETKPQMELENSHQQFANVWRAFAVDREELMDVVQSVRIE